MFNLAIPLTNLEEEDSSFPGFPGLALMLASEPDSKKMFKKFADKLQEIIRFSFMGIALSDQNEITYDWQVVLDSKKRAEKQYRPDLELDDSIIGQTLKKRNFQLGHRNESGSKFLPEGELEQVFHTVLSYPLQTEGKLVGALLVASELQKSIYGEAELRIIRIIAPFLAVAIENHRIKESFAELQKKQNETLKDSYTQMIDNVSEGMLFFDHKEIFYANAPAREQCEAFTQIDFLQKIEKAKELEHEDLETGKFFLCSVVDASWLGQKCKLLTFAEITKNKKLEREQKKLIDKLQESNNDLANLVYVASHDLKTPIRSIASLAQWLIEDHGEDLGETGVHQVDQIVDQAFRLNSLLESIKEYTRVSIDKLKKKNFATKKNIEEIIKGIITDKVVEIDLAENLPPIYNSPKAFQLILQVFINNAFFSLDKDIKKISIDYSFKENSHFFSVKDNGCGIEDRYLEKVFDFFRTFWANSAERQKGLGLALAQKMAARINGEILIESVHKQGTIATLKLPKTQKDGKRDNN